MLTDARKALTDHEACTVLCADGEVPGATWLAIGALGQSQTLVAKFPDGKLAAVMLPPYSLPPAIRVEALKLADAWALGVLA